ncbi:hypothetical protein JRQ81_001380 [Phrynocephalus forsythii]|uniref:Uncharacterized protein n=1 Tax=Phrynocephalus forsythii TaxID=171643 RepID=A0A9Q0Y738_9SAUR|nr:hypothetical protein JRQ81_001380 [Phrynocephalus forsythii]
MQMRMAQAHSAAEMCCRNTLSERLLITGPRRLLPQRHKHSTSYSFEVYTYNVQSVKQSQPPLGRYKCAPSREHIHSHASTPPNLQLMAVVMLAHMLTTGPSGTAPQRTTELLRFCPKLLSAESGGPAHTVSPL